jgi:uncharacterized lipoprotein YehR (DUF1307 family)
MNTKVRTLAVLVLVASLIMSGCGAKKSYALKCDINTQNFSFEITGETGSAITTFHNEAQNYEYDSSGQLSATTVTVNRDLEYQSSKHTYHIEGTITVKQATNEVTYNITATGATFGNSPQTCKKP